MSDIVADTIRAKKIILEGEHGKITIDASTSTIGIWIDGRGEGPMVAIYFTEQQGAVLGAYKSVKESVKGLTVGLVANKNGGAIQMVDADGKARLFDAEHLVREGD